jgi:MFS family permease
VLGISFAATWVLMKDIGFTPGRKESLAREVAGVLRGGFEFGWRNPPVRWVMLGDLFTDGVAIYAFYAMQPFLLQLYGDPHAYGIAGLAAAIVGGAQIGGGILVPRLARLVRRRTTVLLISVIVSAACLGLIGALPGFWTAVTLMTVWGLIFATVMPVRQAYVNGLIPSEHRATVLSFESLMGSAGGVVAQPALGRTADVWGYPASYGGAAIVQVLAVPCLWLARRAGAASDSFEQEDARPTDGG